MEFQGHQAPEHLEQGREHYMLLGARLAQGMPELEKLLGARLACLRKKPSFRALEALCAMMAVLSARKEKSFLELFGTREDIEDKLKKIPSCKSKTSIQRKLEIQKFLENESSYGHGYFAHYTVKPDATLRIAFAPGKLKSTPASLVITERLPLFDCLGSPNDDNADAPLRGLAKTKKWCMQPGTEFAFQVANTEMDEEERTSRVAAADLEADAKLRELLLSGKHVVYLEVVAALAPRDVSREQGHSAIIKAELTNVMREAKNRGEAVVLALGSDSPHTLAQKVYLRQPISDYGLQCGYLRWRASSELPWAREQSWDNRSCLCLQMP